MSYEMVNDNYCEQNKCKTTIAAKRRKQFLRLKKVVVTIEQTYWQNLHNIINKLCNRAVNNVKLFSVKT